MSQTQNFGNIYKYIYVVVVVVESLIDVARVIHNSAQH